MPDQTTDSSISFIYEYCEQNCKKIERWPSYYKRRYLEFKSYMELFPEKRFGRTLELGCGIGYQSAFLSKISDEVIATDLAEEDMAAHSPGMKQAIELHDLLKVHNVKFKACSAEILPFDDNSFDLIYSSHVLEHIPDINNALAEMARVLKPGGIFFCVTPVSFEKFYSIINYYFLLFTRLFVFISKKIKFIFIRNRNGNSKTTGSVKDTCLGRSFWSYFPFPPPHGTGRHFLSEFIEWTPSKWKKIETNTNDFEFVHQQTTQWFPFLPLLGFISPSLGTSLHSLTRKFELKTGRNKIIQYLGINTVIILKKKSKEIAGK